MQDICGLTLNLEFSSGREPSDPARDRLHLIAVNSTIGCISRPETLGPPGDSPPVQASKRPQVANVKRPTRHGIARGARFRPPCGAKHGGRRNRFTGPTSGGGWSRPSAIAALKTVVFSTYRVKRSPLNRIPSAFTKFYSSFCVDVLSTGATL